MNIGQAVKDLRKNKKLSQVELAHKANITQASLSQIENGKRPGIETINRLCKALGISESLLYVMGIEKTDIPQENQFLYDQLFPVIKGLVEKISSAD